MPKLPNVTKQNVVAVIGRAEDVLADLHDISDRIEKGYCDDIAEPVVKARTFISLSKAAAHMAGLLLLQSAMQEQRAEIERLRAKS